MAVREDCRHYSSRTVGAGEVVQRCRVEAALVAPFSCPEDCLFFEPRVITDATWRRGPEQRGPEQRGPEERGPEERGPEQR